jgi:phosphate transport system permease protein
LDSRKITQRAAFTFLGLATVVIVLPVLFIIIYTVVKGGGALTWDFIIQFPSQAGKAGGILPAIIGTFYLMIGTLVFALPIGVLAGIYLTEYARDNWLTRLINLAIVNLAGVPSIVFGLFGLSVFVLAFHFGLSLLAASLTLAAQALAMVITTSREAILAYRRNTVMAAWPSASPNGRRSGILSCHRPSPYHHRGSSGDKPGRRGKRRRYW